MGINYCPECGSKAVGGAKFCPECGSSFGAGGKGAGDRGSPADEILEGVITRSSVSSRGPVKDAVISRSSVKSSGALEDSVVSRSDVRTDRAAIRDAVISHSTITQTETHQYFGDSVGTYETQLDLGKTAHEGRNWEEAVSFFNAALKINPGNHEPWFLKGLCCAELRRTDEAVTNLRRGLRMAGPGAEGLLEDIRELTTRVGKKAKIEEAEANDLLGKAHVELQYSYSYQPSPKPGGEGMRVKALGMELELPKISLPAGGMQGAEGIERRQQADKREAEARKLTENAKEHLSEAVKLYNSAIRYCDLIIEFQKEDEFAWMKRGEIFLRLKLFDDACRSYEALLEFNPYNRDALRLRGMCFKAQGRPIPPPPHAPERTDEVPPAPVSVAAAPQAPAPKARAPAPPAAPPPIPSPEPEAPSGESRPMAPAGSGRREGGRGEEAPAQTPRQTVPPPGPSSPGTPEGSPPQVAPPASPPAAVPGPPPTPPEPSASAPPPARTQGPSGPPATKNPCPFCRGEMDFIRERGIWRCGSCRMYADRPMR